MNLLTLYKKYNQSVKIKLIINVIVIHAVLMGFIMFDLLQRESDFMKEQFSQQANEITSIIASNSSVLLLNNDLVALDELIADMKSRNHTIFILDRTSKVRATTDKEYFNKYFNDAISTNMLKNMLALNKSSAQMMHGDVIDTLHAIEVDNKTIGYVRTLINNNHINKELTLITNKGILYIFAAIFLGAFFAWLSVSKITLRLQNIARATEQIANKDFDIQLEESNTNDEVSKMIRAFNVMNSSIKEYVTELQKSNEIIFREKELAEVTLSSIGDCVIVTDKEGRVQFINPAAQNIIQYSNKEAKDKKIEEIFSLIKEETQERLETPLYASLREKKVIWLSGHTILINRYSKQFSIEDSSAPIKNKDGAIEGAIFVFHDVTQKKKDEIKVRWQATHDGLTGLNNRISFETILENTSKQTLRDNTTHALLFMDLDKFKIINDTVGHMAGDEVLKQISLRISHAIRANDFLCRFGGDEFGLILFNCDVALSKEIAKKLIDDILDYTFHWEDKVFRVGLSVGITIIDKHHHDPSLLLSSADLACYMAKEKGRSRFYIAQESDLVYLNNEHELNWISKITQAIKDKKFILHVQKIKDLEFDNNHYEILLRLKEDNGAIVYPNSFIPHAERYFLMPKIDRYVIEEFFSWYTTNKDSIDDNIHFSVNITGQSISDVDFIEDVLTLVTKYEIDCSKVIFEITENTAISNIAVSKKFFSTLTKIGFRFSLDDFGTGLSSFEYLKSLPIDFLKIDGVFIKDILEDKIDRGMVESIYKIGSLMHLKIIAEYVESEAIMTELKKIGIHYAQGYVIEKPHSINDLLG